MVAWLKQIPSTSGAGESNSFAKKGIVSGSEKWVRQMWLSVQMEFIEYFMESIDEKG